MSDSHDKLDHIERAVKHIQTEKADLIIHCGDIESPLILQTLTKTKIPIHFVYGNMDKTSKSHLAELAESQPDNLFPHGDEGELTIDNRKIGFTHKDNHADALIAYQAYDMVFYGHTHLFHQEMLGQTLVLNPGEILGRKEQAGFCLVDISKNVIKHILLD